MASYKDRVKLAQKEKVSDKLTATQWEPNAGDELVGELVHREVIQKKDNQKVYDKLTLRTDNGLYDTIIRSGILAMAQPPVKIGDLFVIHYNGMKDLGGGKEMHDTTVEVIHVEDGAPF